MVKKIIRRIKTRKVMRIAKKYAKEVMKDYEVETILLFGSYAKGTNHEDSDIDIAVVTNVEENKVWDEELKLVKLRRNIDVRIEPHLIELEDYKNVSNPFVKEIIDTGIKVI